MAHLTSVFMLLLLIGAGWSWEEKDMKEKKEKEVPNLKKFVQDVRTVINDIEEDLKEVSNEMEQLKKVKDASSPISKEMEQLKKVKDASSSSPNYDRRNSGKCSKIVTEQQCREAARWAGKPMDITFCKSCYPQGCYEMVDYWYNSKHSDQSCTSIAECLCQVDRDECGWTLQSDGMGADEKETHRHATDRDDCARMCKEMKKTNGKINGATYAPGSKRCWCEIRMISRKEDSTYESCFLTDNRGINYGSDGCRENDKCDAGNGDCDNDSECGPGLICGKDNCAWGVHEAGDVSADCCFRPHCNEAAKGTCCTKAFPCDRGEGYCAKDEDCVAPLKCIPGADICGGKNYGGSGCTESDPCAPGNGDCDFDSQCEGADTICGFNNCAWGGTDDCCHKRRCHEEENCCSKETPCDRNEGKCDADEQCLFGLECIDETCQLKCNGRDDCCNDGKCGVMQGDCDRDSHCKGNLKCGNRNSCRWGGTDACCYDPSKGQWYY